MPVIKVTEVSDYWLFDSQEEADEFIRTRSGEFETRPATRDEILTHANAIESDLLRGEREHGFTSQDTRVERERVQSLKAAAEAMSE